MGNRGVIMETSRTFWQDFRICYGPALVGGIFLCIADLMASERQGQIVKVGGIVQRNFLHSSGSEVAVIGVIVVLALGAMLCWVWRPNSPSDSFSKGASVFALLAALVPADRPPPTITQDPNAPPPMAAAPSVPVASEALPPGLHSGDRQHGIRPVMAGLFPAAHAQMVIPLSPTGKVRIVLQPSAGLSEAELANKVRREGADVWLFDPKTGRTVAHDRVGQPAFTIEKPQGQYTMELALEGTRRIRMPLKIGPEPVAYNVPIGAQTSWPGGLQLLIGADIVKPTVNKTETSTFRGAELSRRGDYPEAIASYDKALQSEPKNVQTLNYKGYALYRLGKFQEAAAVLDDAVKLEPSHFLSRLNLAKTRCRLGQADLAQQAIVGPPPLTPDELRVTLADGEFTRVCKVIVSAVKQKLAQLRAG